MLRLGTHDATRFLFRDEWASSLFCAHIHHPVVAAFSTSATRGRRAIDTDISRTWRSVTVCLSAASTLSKVILAPGICVENGESRISAHCCVGLGWSDSFVGVAPPPSQCTDTGVRKRNQKWSNTALRRDSTLATLNAYGRWTEENWKLRPHN